MPIGKEALKGALNRMEERPSNRFSSEALQAHRGRGCDWNNWPDWGNESDFPNWENIGGNPPKKF